MASPKYNNLERGDSLYNEGLGEDDVLEMTRIPSQGALRYIHYPYYLYNTDRTQGEPLGSPSGGGNIHSRGNVRGLLSVFPP
jgi:hypothetical protein